MTSFMVADAEIGRMLYVKNDSAIAWSLGVARDRVAAVRAKQKPAKDVAPKTPSPNPERTLAEPLEQETAPSLCPTCGSPVSGVRLMIRHIQTLVAAYYNIPVSEMTSARRQKEFAHPRQVAMYLSRYLTPKSLPDIGRRFGGRDHTTVIYAISQVQKRILEDAEIEADVKTLHERMAA